MNDILRYGLTVVAGEEGRLLAGDAAAAARALRRLFLELEYREVTAEQASAGAVEELCAAMMSLQAPCDRVEFTARLLSRIAEGFVHPADRATIKQLGARVEGEGESEAQPKSQPRATNHLDLDALIASLTGTARLALQVAQAAAADAAATIWWEIDGSQSSTRCGQKRKGCVSDRLRAATRQRRDRRWTFNTKKVIEPCLLFHALLLIFTRGFVLV